MRTRGQTQCFGEAKLIVHGCGPGGLILKFDIDVGSLGDGAERNLFGAGARVAAGVIAGGGAGVACHG